MGVELLPDRDQHLVAHFCHDIHAGFHEDDQDRIEQQCDRCKPVQTGVIAD